MSDTRIAIIGSGIVGIAIAHQLTSRGYHVDIYEKGRLYPYPTAQLWDAMTNQRLPESAVIAREGLELPADLKHHSHSGRQTDIETSRYMWTGGSATLWEAITPRMRPSDFASNTLYGFGDDWPITYDDLEPYYGLAEAYLGVSGTDADNPFAPPRSTPYPLPHFELAHDDLVLADRLAQSGIVLHSTPQARTRQSHDGRSPCVNFGTCRYCPIGARYFPNVHLQRMVTAGLCTLLTEVSVRRVVPDRDGGGATVVYRQHDSQDDQEAHYEKVIIACGAIETARLLLLSADERHPDGLGNQSGWVGQGLTLHHTWRGFMEYDINLYSGRVGFWTGQSDQFLEPETRGQHGGVKVEFSSRTDFRSLESVRWGDITHPDTLREKLAPLAKSRPIAILSETPADANKYVALSAELDRFGDAFAHVHYELSDFDASTYDFSLDVYTRISRGSAAVGGYLNPLEMWDSAAHHMGTARMSHSETDGAVNSYGELHTAKGVFALGGSMFVGSGGAVNPTLTMVALAIRCAEYLLEQLLED
jgi:choline dehydrogenase-like flavoprotein